jgi:hypothetical protein
MAMRFNKLPKKQKMRNFSWSSRGTNLADIERYLGLNAHQISYLSFISAEKVFDAFCTVYGLPTYKAEIKLDELMRHWKLGGIEDAAVAYKIPVSEVHRRIKMATIRAIKRKNGSYVVCLPSR